MSNPLFWLFWCAILCIGAWKIVEGLLKPKHLLEWPFLASASWLYFYVYMAYDAAIGSDGVIRSNALILGELMPLLSLIAILWGWEMAKPKDVRKSVPYAKLSNRLAVWWIGIGLAIVGGIGGYLLQNAASAGKIDYKTTSAYVYLMYNIGYPGLALALWVAARWGKGFRWFIVGITVAAVTAYIYPHVAALRRGPTFPAILLLLMVPPLARKSIPSRLVYVSGLAGIGVAMLVFIQLRTVIYNKGTWNEAVNTMNVKEAVTERGKSIYDNEFVNNCHIIEALTQNGKYQYGTGHLSLFLHWIPRSMWKSKPDLGEGIYSFDELFSDVDKSAGIKLLGGGAAAGGVADSFIQYGFLCPLFWFGLSWLASKAYWRGQINGQIVWMQTYIAFVCGTHWLISQGFAATFVPMVIFLIIPVIALRLVGKVHQPRRKQRVLQSPTHHESSRREPFMNAD